MNRISLLLILLLSGVVSQGQYMLKGLVLSSGDYSTLANCSMVLTNENGAMVQKTFTDRNGYFTLAKVVAGNYTLAAYMAGYKSEVKQLSVTQNRLDLIFELKPLQVVSDEVVVESIQNKKRYSSTHTDLSAKEIQRYNFAPDLPVILNTTPGAVSTSDAGNGVGYTGIRIRGVDATRINVTINGVPYNDAESHGVFWVDLPDLAANTRSIQVQRGVGTSTNGSAAFGASINIQTSKASADPYAQYTTAYGSFNTFRNNILFGTGLLKSHWTMEGSLSKISTNGYIDRATGNLKSGYGSITRYGDKSLLKFNIFSGSEKTYQAWYGVPEDSLKTNRRYNPYTYKNQTDNYTQTHYQLLYTYQYSPKLTLNSVAHYTKGKGYYENYEPGMPFSAYGLPDYLLKDSTYLKTSDFITQKWLSNDFYGVIASAVYKEKDYEAQAGASYNTYSGLHYNDMTWSGAWTAPLLNGTFEPYRYFNDKATKHDGTVYGKVYYNVKPDLQVFGDLQLRSLQYNYNTPSSTGLQPFTKNYFFFNPKAGANLMLKDSAGIVFTYGRSSHEPTRDEFVQSTRSSLPSAEHLNDFELAYTKYYKEWHITVNAYLMQYRNQLVLTGKLNDVGNPVRENVKNSNRKGIEIMVKHRFTNALSWNVNASYGTSRIRNYNEYVYNYTHDTATVFKYKRTPISFSPSLVLGSSFVYLFSKQFEAELLSKYVSKQYLDNTGSESRMLNAYFVNDLFLRYHITSQTLFDDLYVSAAVYNIFNTLYENNGASYSNMVNGVRMYSNYYFPQAPQHFMIMLTARF